VNDKGGNAMKPIWIWRSHAGVSQHIGSRTVTPVFRSIGLHWPGGGWLWQFPLAVEVKDESNGAQQRLPIPDPTRAAIWLLLALALVTVFVMTRSRRRNQALGRRPQPKRMKG